MVTPFSPTAQALMDILNAPDAEMSKEEAHMVATKLNKVAKMNTKNAPIMEAAEWRAQQIYGGMLHENSVQRGNDLIDPINRLISVKGRQLVNLKRNGQMKLSRPPSTTNLDFDLICVIVYDDEGMFHSAWEITKEDFVNNIPNPDGDNKKKMSTSTKSMDTWRRLL